MYACTYLLMSKGWINTLMSIYVSDSRNLMCGRCTRSAAGISSQLAIASANSTKISLDRANASSLPLSMLSRQLEHVVLRTAARLQHHNTVTPPMFQTGLRSKRETRQTYFFYPKKEKPLLTTSPTFGTVPVFEEMTRNFPGYLVFFLSFWIFFFFFFWQRVAFYST